MDMNFTEIYNNLKMKIPQNVVPETVDGFKLNEDVVSILTSNHSTLDPRIAIAQFIGMAVRLARNIGWNPSDVREIALGMIDTCPGFVEKH